MTEGTTRVNVGCGEWPLEGWTNLDADPAMGPDIVAQVPPLPFGDGELDEVYAGHLLEHLHLDDGKAFLRECYRCLKPGGKIGVVVPDVYEVMRRYVNRMPDAVYINGFWWNVSDLDAVGSIFLYSPSAIQKSRHEWSYDARTLQRIMFWAGFVDLTPIDRYRDARLGIGTWYQCGWDGRKAA